MDESIPPPASCRTVILMPLATYVPVLSCPTPDGEQLILLDRDSTSIGRLPSNDVVQSYPFVSRRHAVLVREGAAYFVDDLNSTHGTFVNGQRIAGRAALGIDDVLQLGSLKAPRLRFHLQFKDGRPADSNTPRVQDLIASISGILPANLQQPDKPVAREMEQLNFLLSAARALNAGEAIEDILRALLQLTLQLTGVERGFVFLREEGEMRLSQGLRSDGTPVYEDSTISRGAIKAAIESDSKFSVSDTLNHENVSAWSSIMVNHIRSIYCIPLRKRATSTQPANLLGLLYLDSQIGTGKLGAIDHELLDAIAAEAAGLLHNALLAQDEYKARQAREELAVAARIHSGLMSIKLPTLPFAVLDARTVPCLAIGGDFFDAIALDDHVSVTVADVSGKGVSAAIVAATLQGIIHAQLMARQNLPDIATLVNQFLCNRDVNKYATMVILKVYSDGRVEYLNCGHIRPVAVLGEEVNRLPDGNLVVGLISSATYTSAPYRLRPGERILLATDGITEAEDLNGECIGEDGLNAICRLNSLDEMLGHVARFQAPGEAQDDCTLVQLRYTAQG